MAKKLFEECWIPNECVINCSNDSSNFLAFAIFNVFILLLIPDGWECPKNGTEIAYFPHQEDCWKYYMCSNGIAIEMTCTPGTYWNQEIEVCDHFVDCGTLLTTTGATILWNQSKAEKGGFQNNSVSNLNSFTWISFCTAKFLFSYYIFIIKAYTFIQALNSYLACSNLFMPGLYYAIYARYWILFNSNTAVIIIKI